MFDGADPGSLSDEVLEARVLGYAAQIIALTADFLDLVGELDERESWRGPGFIHSRIGCRGRPVLHREPRTST